MSQKSLFDLFFHPPPPPKGDQRSTKCHKIDRGGQGEVYAQPWPATPPISHDLVEPTSKYHPAKKHSKNAHPNVIVVPAPSRVKTQPEGPRRCIVGQGGPLGSPPSPPGTHNPGAPLIGPGGHCQIGTFSSQNLQNRPWSHIGGVRARLSGVVGALVVWGGVTYYHEARLKPLITMKEGFEALLGHPQIGTRAPSSTTPEQG